MKKGVIIYIVALSTLSFFGVHACTDIDDEEIPMEICGDSIDNDGDGLMDCEDPDCALSTECTAENCTDEIDNDGDGLVDCEDSECSCG